MRRNAQRSHDGQLVGCFAQEDDWQSNLGKQDADADVTSATVIRISTSPQETSREPRGLESVASRRESNGFERRKNFHAVVASDTFGVPQRRCLGTRFSSGHTCQLKRLAAFDAVYRLYTFFSFIGLLIPVPRRSPFERSTFFVRSRRSDSS